MSQKHCLPPLLATTNDSTLQLSVISPSPKGSHSKGIHFMGNYYVLYWGRAHLMTRNKKDWLLLQTRHRASAREFHLSVVQRRQRHVWGESPRSLSGLFAPPFLLLIFEGTSRYRRGFFKNKNKPHLFIFILAMKTTNPLLVTESQEYSLAGERKHILSVHACLSEPFLPRWKEIASVLSVAFLLRLLVAQGGRGGSRPETFYLIRK